MQCGGNRSVRGKIYCYALMLLLAAANVKAQQRQISVHDPVMIRQGKTFYVFSTGRGIRVWSSDDLLSWQQKPSVFNDGPDWAQKAVAGFKNFIWAPDIQFLNGQYYLYYCASMFGKNTSAIGVATNKTLDEKSPDFKWEDHGMIIESVPGKTNWNAIDPNVFVDEQKQAWLTFGSFWGGIQLVKLNKDLISVSAENLNRIKTIASYKGTKAAAAEEEIKANAIEAPFLFKKGKYHYLFASAGFCCRGNKSTYRMIVGRSKQVGGPYLDDKGQAMEHGGGRLVLEGNADWYGVGHNSAYTFDGTDYLVFHGYDAKNNAQPRLRMEKLQWKNGWPVLEQKIN